MSSLFFWKTWSTSNRNVWFMLSFLFIFSILFMWFSYFQGAEGIIDWLKLQDQKVIETAVHQFKLGPFELTVPGESYVIFEYFQGSELHHNITASYIFLFVLVFCAM